ncbi:MAG: hypothetical protein AAFR13_03945 [Pseudomonadota bacterium]
MAWRGLGVKTAVTLTTLAVMPTVAAAQDVQFNGSVASSCSINVTRNGTLAPNPTHARRLASGQPGGQHGLATITADAFGYTLFADPPTSFAEEPTADLASPENFFAYTRAFAGATNWVWTQAGEALNPGSTNIRIRFAAQKAGSVSFANGNYRGVITLRCE